MLDERKKAKTKNEANKTPKIEKKPSGSSMAILLTEACAALFNR